MATAPRLMHTVLTLLAWALPLTYVAAIPQPGLEWRAERRTQKRLKSDVEAVLAFTKHFKVAPRSLADVRVFAKTEHIRFNAYDAFGARFDFLKLGDQDYFLRSFGADGVQNTVTSTPDIAATSWGNKVFMGLATPFTEHGDTTLYPPQLVEGLLSPNQDWLARIYIEKEGGLKRLVAHNRKKAQFLMIAPHEMIEEFLWLPSGYQIIYTAGNGAQSSGGLFVWDILKDSITRIPVTTTVKPKANEIEITAAANAEEPGLALAGVHPTTGHVLLRCLRPSMSGAQMFRAMEHVLEFDPAQSTAVDCTPNMGGPSDTGGAAAVEMRFDPRPGCSESEGSVLQREYCRLPLTGSIDSVISAWQGFIGRFPESPLVPYAIFTTALLYSDAYRSIAAGSPRDADVLRSLGAAFAKKLPELPLAPMYLQMLGAAMYQGFLDVKMPPLKVIDFQSPATPLKK